MRFLIRNVIMISLFLCFGAKFSFSNSLHFTIPTSTPLKSFSSKKLFTSSKSITEDVQIEKSSFIEVELTDNEEEEEEENNKGYNFQFLEWCRSNKLDSELNLIILSKNQRFSKSLIEINSNWYIPYAKVIGFV